MRSDSFKTPHHIIFSQMTSETFRYWLSFSCLYLLPSCGLNTCITQINQISLQMISRTLSISFLEAEILGFRCMVQMIHKIIRKYDVYVV